MTEKLVLHEYSASGNCYKVRLTAAHAGLALERREYDILKGETRTPVFLNQINANGRIPVLQVGERFIPESNAACFYLGDGTHLIPEDRFERADMLRWMSFEQSYHEPNIATLRFWLQALGESNLNPVQKAQLSSKKTGGDAALKIMDDHLASHSFFVAGRLTLADIALYPYTHVAEGGGFDVSAFPHILQWMDRVAAVPGHIPMDA